MAYRIDFDIDAYPSLYISMDAMEEVMDDLYYPEGEPLMPVWAMPEGELVDGKSQGRKMPQPDICNWEGNLVLSPKAYQVLQKEVEKYAELLPVKVSGEVWHIVNVTFTTDAVDHESSEKDLRGGIYVGLKSLAFLDQELTDTLLFKTEFDEKVGNFCNQKFKELLQSEYELTGVTFRGDLERP